MHTENREKDAKKVSVLILGETLQVEWVGIVLANTNVRHLRAKFQVSFKHSRDCIREISDYSSI